MDLKKYQDELRKFADERDWHKFHTPENLAKSISIEAGELLECFQWEPEGIDLNNVARELADILIYLLMLADKLKLDLETLVKFKIASNHSKYPVAESRGNAIKYNKR
jgi:NTP pyrophosphatase (non-canonical NTP hydrolase)